MQEIKTPNLSKVDWERIAKDIKVTSHPGTYAYTSTELDDKWVEELRASVILDVKSNINEEIAKNVFVIRRMRHTLHPKIKELSDDISAKYISEAFAADELFKDCLYQSRIRAYSDDFEEYKGHIKKDNNSFAAILTKMDIHSYSIPYGQPRTISTNEDKEVVMWAYSPILGVGSVIVKFKTKYQGIKLTKSRSVCSVEPIELRTALKMIGEITNTPIKTGRNQSHDKGIKEQVKKEEQTEVERNI